MANTMLSGEERRKQILNKITESDKPVSATALAKELGVSRQIIVGDIALLRAGEVDIIATNRGYIISKGPSAATIRVKTSHKREDIYDELCTIVDLGARVVTEEISNDLYGTISVDININSHEDARVFSERALESSNKALSETTGGLHFHTITADNELVLLRVQKALNDKGYLKK